MKKLQMKITLLGLAGLMFMGVLLTGCSKDSSDDAPRTGKIDDAVGTYKGTLYNSILLKDYFNAVVIVTKEGDNKLRITAKADEEYSNITPKVFTVEVGDFFGPDPIDVASLTGSVGGFFHYYGESKTISVYSTKLQETDITFDFEGVKQ